MKPERIRCKSCLMRFLLGKPPRKSIERFKCPQCYRHFWCTGNTEKITAGIEPKYHLEWMLT